MIALLAVAGVVSPFAFYALMVALSDRALSWPAEGPVEMEDAT